MTFEVVVGDPGGVGLSVEDATCASKSMGNIAASSFAQNHAAVTPGGDSGGDRVNLGISEYANYRVNVAETQRKNSARIVDDIVKRQESFNLVFRSVASRTAGTDDSDNAHAAAMELITQLKNAGITVYTSRSPLPSKFMGINAFMDTFYGTNDDETVNFSASISSLITDESATVTSGRTSRKYGIAGPKYTHTFEQVAGIGNVINHETDGGSYNVTIGENGDIRITAATAATTNISSTIQIAIPTITDEGELTYNLSEFEEVVITSSGQVEVVTESGEVVIVSALTEDDQIVGPTNIGIVSVGTESGHIESAGMFVSVNSTTSLSFVTAPEIVSVIVSPESNGMGAIAVLFADGAFSALSYTPISQSQDVVVLNEAVSGGSAVNQYVISGFVETTPAAAAGFSAQATEMVSQFTQSAVIDIADVSEPSSSFGIITTRSSTGFSRVNPSNDCGVDVPAIISGEGGGSGTNKTQVIDGTTGATKDVSIASPPINLDVYCVMNNFEHMSEDICVCWSDPTAPVCRRRRLGETSSSSSSSCSIRESNTFAITSVYSLIVKRCLIPEAGQMNHSDLLSCMVSTLPIVGITLLNEVCFDCVATFIDEEINQASENIVRNACIADPFSTECISNINFENFLACSNGYDPRFPMLTSYCSESEAFDAIAWSVYRGVVSTCIGKSDEEMTDCVTSSVINVDMNEDCRACWDALMTSITKTLNNEKIISDACQSDPASSECTNGIIADLESFQQCSGFNPAIMDYKSLLSAGQEYSSSSNSADTTTTTITTSITLFTLGAAILVSL